MSLEVTDLLLFSLFSGIGTGIGTPIGNAIYKRFIQPHIHKIDSTLNIIKLNGKDIPKDAWGDD